MNVSNDLYQFKSLHQFHILERAETIILERKGKIIGKGGGGNCYQGEKRKEWEGISNGLKTGW